MPLSFTVGHSRPSHYWRRALSRVPVALGKGSFALGKANTRQRASVESPSGKGYIAECQILGTRQRLCRVPCGHSAKIWRRLFAECHSSGTRQRNLFFLNLFAECHSTGTRQRVFFFNFLCRVQWPLHSAKPPLNFFFLFFAFPFKQQCIYI